jgi:hypothetical protein
MTEIVALLQLISPLLEKTVLRQLSQVVFGMLAASGRITMLGLSRWTDKGGSYRTIQRLYHTVLDWKAIQWMFFQKRFLKKEEEYILGGDEVVVSKSGKETYGVDRFFAGLQQQVIPSVSFFAFALINVKEEHAYPLQISQIVKTEAEKTTGKGKKGTKQAAKPTEKRKRGRPKRSKNKVKTEEKVELSAELLRIQQGLRSLLATIGTSMVLCQRRWYKSIKSRNEMSTFSRRSDVLSMYVGGTPCSERRTIV